MEIILQYSDSLKFAHYEKNTSVEKMLTVCNCTQLLKKKSHMNQLFNWSNFKR